MQRKHLALIIALTIIFSTVIPATASSPSATPMPSASPADTTEIVNENVKKRLQDSLKTKEATPLSRAKGFIGIVKDVIKDTEVIQDKDGKKDIKLDDDTFILRTPGNITIKIDNIRIDDYIIAIGYPDETDILAGRRLILSVDPIKPPAKVSGLGIIRKLSKTSITIDDKELTLTSKTISKSAVGSIELTDLSEGDTLIYTATTDIKDNLTATILMRVLSASIAE